MKHAFILILITLVVVSVTSCKEQTNFSEVNSIQNAEKLNVPEGDNRCVDFSIDEAQCVAVMDCQGLYNEKNIFLSCIPLDVIEQPEVPVAEEPTTPIVVVPEVDPPVVYVEETYEEEPEVVTEEAVITCGNNNKVVVCHYPQGRLDKGKSLCINRHGFDHGHDDNHVGDHLGPCSQSDLDQD